MASAYQALIWLLPFGFYQEREALHQRALMAAPNDPEVRTLKAWSCAQVGRFREALEYAKQAYDLDPLRVWVANAYATFVPSYELSRDLWQTFPRAGRIMTPSPLMPSEPRRRTATGNASTNSSTTLRLGFMNRSFAVSSGTRATCATPIRRR